MPDEYATPPRLACDAFEIPEDERRAHRALLQSLFALPGLEPRWNAEGCMVRFPTEERGRIAKFVANEGRCCALLEFRVEDSAGEVRLYLSGPTNTRAIIEACFPEPGRNDVEDADRG